MRWPGAVTVAKGGKFTSIYVGYGLKRGGPCQQPVEPGEVLKDPTEAKEMPEPYPLTEPPAKVEGEENKEEGEEGEEENWTELWEISTIRKLFLFTI